MSLQDILDQKESEIVLVYEMVTHPAGFIVDLFGGELTIRPHCDGYEVAWKDYLDGMECNFHRDFRDNEAKEAATFFVEKRFEFQLGIDFENALMKEAKNE